MSEQEPQTEERQEATDAQFDALAEDVFRRFKKMFEELSR